MSDAEQDLVQINARIRELSREIQVKYQHLVGLRAVKAYIEGDNEEPDKKEESSDGV